VPEDHPCYAGVLFHALSNHVAEISIKQERKEYATYVDSPA
jgi:hypothetical protein